MSDPIETTPDVRIAPCGHEVRHVDGRPVIHDTDGLEPVGRDYWGGDNPEGIRHAKCRRGLPRFDKHNARTTSDLAGLAASDAGYAAPVNRVAEIRGRLDAVTLTPGAGIEAHGEALRVVWTHAPDDIRYLLNELAGYQSDILAGEAALKQVRRERDAALTALAEFEAEINRGRPGYSWISDEALASLTKAQQRSERERRLICYLQERVWPSDTDGETRRARWFDVDEKDQAAINEADAVFEPSRFRCDVCEDLLGGCSICNPDPEAADRVLKGP